MGLLSSLSSNMHLGREYAPIRLNLVCLYMCIIACADNDLSDELKQGLTKASLTIGLNIYLWKPSFTTAELSRWPCVFVLLINILRSMKQKRLFAQVAFATCDTWNVFMLSTGLLQYHVRSHSARLTVCTILVFRGSVFSLIPFWPLLCLCPPSIPGFITDPLASSCLCKFLWHQMLC